MTGELAATGYSPASLRVTAAGKLQGTLRGITFTGFDLAAAGRLLQSPPPKPRAALTKAMSTGVTAPLNGTLQMTEVDDALTYAQCQLEGPSGSIAFSGAVDETGSGSWLALSASPALVPAVPALRVEEANGQRKLDLSAALAWAAAAKRSGKAAPNSIH